MKLYEIPKGSKIKIGEHNVTFHKIDGMYSYCTIDGTEDVIHLSASANLTKVDDVYELENTPSLILHDN